MQERTRVSHWNELQFVSWGEFKRMTPSILQLEITRLGGIIERRPADTAFRNALVRARFSLRRFVECLAAERDALEPACADHLATAIMSISLLPDDLDEETRRACRYVRDRLDYVYHRIGMIY
jgi:hypothetical protein